MDETKILSEINSPDDLKKLNKDLYPPLCEEIRDILVDTISKNGGHLASNLGVVELTVAMHLSFNTPNDQFVWDVGHQCYTHKLLTGRRDNFCTLRTEDGIGGFPRRTENIHDSFIGGHASTSISAAFGLAKAKTIKKEEGHVVAVIGDGALTGGLSYEALNNAGRSKDNLIVVLNDNKMSISKNVGAMARYLMTIRARPAYFKIKTIVEKILRHLPVIGRPIKKLLLKSKSMIKNAVYHSTIFEEMGFSFMGPVDGHDIKALCTNFEYAKKHKSPVLIHVMTVKGKGYKHAENDPKSFHGLSGFDILTGDINTGTDNFSEQFGDELCRLAQNDERIVAVSAAMKLGTGLGKFSYDFRNRFFDVGIAEEHAVTFCAGMSANGIIPVFAVYSSFLQRSYDQIIHDAALQNLKIILAIDRAGIVGEDGETHQGVFDVSFLQAIPNVTIYAPTYYEELHSFLHKGIYEDEGVIAIRYPRGKASEIPGDFKVTSSDYDFVGNKQSKKLLITYGRLFANAYKAYEASKDFAIVKINRLKPLNKEIIDIIEKFDNAVFYEEAIIRGGVGEYVEAQLMNRGYKGKIKVIGIDDSFIEQSTVDSALKKLGFDCESMIKMMNEC